MPRLPVLLSALMFILFANGFGWGYHDAMEYGSPLVCVTPVSSAMGGAWALPSGGSASIFLNPAELSLLPGTRINVSSGLVQWHTYSHGLAEFDHHQSGTVFGGITASAGFRISNDVSVGFGVTEVSDFRFDGENLEIEIVGPGLYEVLGVDYLDSKGSLWEVNAGISCKITHWLLAGFSGGVRSGSGSYTHIWNASNPQGQDDTTNVDWDTADFCGHVGLLMPMDFGTFGISGTNASMKYRSRVAVGFQRKMEVLNGSILGIELDAQSIENDETELAGRFFGRFEGLMPGVNTIYSIGFIRANEYHRNAMCFSTGAAIHLGDVDLELAVSWRSRSRAGICFTDQNINNIDDSGTYYNVGMSWSL